MAEADQGPQPRPITAMRYRLKTVISPQTERIARLEDEASCFILLTNVPAAGELAHSARDILTVYRTRLVGRSKTTAFERPGAGQ